MVKRKILALGLLIISALCTFSAWAELNYLNVSLRSGTVDVYALAEKPVISVVDGATILIKSPEVETTYNVGDIVKLKKQHPCGSFEWEILRVGADFRLKCMGCGHQIMIARKLVEKNTRGLRSPETAEGKTD